jgi:signal transduction histidine kinase
MKVRTHVLILMLVTFGGSIILGILGLYAYSNYRENRESMDTATSNLLNQGTFFLATRFSTFVTEYINIMGVSKIDIYDSTDDQIVLIKESYNRFINAFSSDEDFRNKLAKIEFFDSSNLTNEIESGSLAEQVELFESSIYNWNQLSIERKKYTSGYGLANRIKNEFEKNSFVNVNLLQSAQLFLSDKEKYSQNYQDFNLENKSKLQSAAKSLDENLENLSVFLEKLDSAISIIQDEIKTNFENQKNELEEDANLIRWFLVIISAGYFCIVIYIGFTTYKTFASPIQKLELAAKNSIEYNKPFKLRESGPYEIRSLTRRLQGLVIGLEQTVQTRTEQLLAKTKHLENEIIQRKELETQLVHAQKMEAVGQLASGIAHEINSPSQFANDNILFLKEAVSGFIAKLRGSESAPDLKELQFLAENAPDAVDQASEGINRITTIVKSMKNFAYKDAQSAKKPSDLNQAIRSTVVVATNEWKYHAELNMILDESLPFVPCNIGEINQVVLNLVVNGAHAIRDHFSDGQKGNLLISTKHYEDAGCAIIAIKDNGGGIPKEVSNRIFEPFFTTKEVGVGTGQGLAIAHNVITKSHGGQIWFETEERKGTTFFIKLPMFQNESK